MDAMIVYESMFGNTARIARAIGDGLADQHDVTVTVTNVADAPAAVPAEVALVIVGGPTHAFAMSRRSTREGAVQRGAVDAEVARGIREWMEALPPGPHPQHLVAFDTRVDLPLLPGAASRSATRAARRRGFRVMDPESFLVEGYEGPLVDGEAERARAWGGSLAHELAAV